MNPGRLLHCVLLAFAMLPLQGCSRDYSATAIEAWIVDTETKQPLEGVVVVADWKLEFGLEGGQSAELKVMETVTDKNGRFYFPPWGPMEIPKDLPSEARLKDRDPQILMFLNGYEPEPKITYRERPIKSMGGHGASVRSWEGNGKIIGLAKFNGDMKDYASRLGELWGSLLFAHMTSRDCEWKLVPRMIAALIKQYKILKDQNIGSIYFQIPPFETFPNQQVCGSAKEFFKDYLK